MSLATLERHAATAVRRAVLTSARPAAAWADTEAAGPGADDPVAEDQPSRSDFGELTELRAVRARLVHPDADATPTVPVPPPGYSATERTFDLERTHRWLGWLYPTVATLAAVVSIAYDKGWI